MRICEEETEELKDSLQSLQNDYGNLGVGIELLEEEIYGGYPISNEKIKKLIGDIETWIEEVGDCITPIDDARIIFNKKQILNKL